MGLNMAVCIKMVPATGAVSVNQKDFTLERKKTEMVPNPADCSCFETALRLKEKYGGSVALISMGRPETESQLRALAAVGGDSFFLITDPAYAGADTYATARVLCRAIQYLGGIDLILCGERTTDGETGQVGPELSAMLGWKFAGCITALEMLPEGRMRCTGRTGISEYPLPLAVSVRRNCVLRYPGLKGLRRAGQVAVNQLNAELLQERPQSLTRVISMQRKEVSRRKAVLCPTDESGILDLFGKLGLDRAFPEK